MEDIRSLREICQKPRLGADTWYGRHFARVVSIYITRVFLGYKVSANAVTFLFTIIGIAASFSLSFGSRKLIFLGAVLLQLWYILDHVDGEIARYKHQSSLTGVYFDKISHYIVHPLVFFLLGLGLYRNSANFIYIALGFISGFSVLMISIENDIKELTLFYRYSSSEFSIQKRQDIAKPKENSGKLKKIFMFLHNLCTYPNIMNFIALTATIDVLFGLRSISFILYFYSVAATLVWIARVFFIVKTKQIDLQSK